MFMTAFITLVAAYLIGSVNFAVIFTKKFASKDIREMGSGNAGATNTMRNCGFLPGLLTFLCDALKGFAASGIGFLIFSYLLKTTGNPLYMPIYGAYVCGFLCMIGHVFPIFFDFRGGKGVAVAVGIFAVCSPVAIAIGLGIFAAVLLVTRIVSLASVSATVAVVVLAAIFAERDGTALLWPQILFCVLMGATIILKHIPNIKRLISGEESKVNLGRKH